MHRVDGLLLSLVILQSQQPLFTDLLSSHYFWPVAYFGVLKRRKCDVRSIRSSEGLKLRLSDHENLYHIYPGSTINVNQVLWSFLHSHRHAHHPPESCSSGNICASQFLTVWNQAFFDRNICTWCKYLDVGGQSCNMIETDRKMVVESKRHQH